VQPSSISDGFDSEVLDRRAPIAPAFESTPAQSAADLQGATGMNAKESDYAIS
jgi:hypothetical protein